MFKEDIWYVKMALRIGLHKHVLAARMLECDTLDEMRVLMNEELGTNIQKGQLLESVYQEVDAAIGK